MTDYDLYEMDEIWRVLLTYEKWKEMAERERAKRVPTRGVVSRKPLQDIQKLPSSPSPRKATS